MCNNDGITWRKEREEIDLSLRCLKGPYSLYDTRKIIMG